MTEGLMDVTVNDIALRCAIQSVQIDRLNEQLSQAWEQNMVLVEELSKQREDGEKDVIFTADFSADPAPQATPVTSIASKRKPKKPVDDDA